MDYLKIKNYKIKNCLLAFVILMLLLSSYVAMPVPPAKAGLIFRIPSNLGLANGLVGYWTMDGGDIC